MILLRLIRWHQRPSGPPPLLPLPQTEVLQFNARLKQAEYENNILRKELERSR